MQLKGLKMWARIKQFNDTVRAKVDGINFVAIFKHFSPCSRHNRYTKYYTVVSTFQTCV